MADSPWMTASKNDDWFGTNVPMLADENCGNVPLSRAFATLATTPMFNVSARKRASACNSEGSRRSIGISVRAAETRPRHH